MTDRTVAASYTKGLTERKYENRREYNSRTHNPKIAESLADGDSPVTVSILSCCSAQQKKKKALSSYAHQS